MVGLSNIFKIVGQACTNFVREEKAAILREKQTKSLLEAIMASDSDKVEALLKAGVDADAPSTMGNTPLTCAISLRATQRTPESLKVLELVLARVTDIDGITKDSSYLLMAAQIGVAEAAAELLRRGCDMTVKGWGGRDALCFATENGHKSVADLIVAARQQRNEACAANMHAGLDKPIAARKRLRLKTFS